MTGHAHSPAEWAAFLSLGAGGYAALSVLYFLTVDADLADFDPRPAVRRALESGHQAAVHAGHDLNRAIALVLHDLRIAWTQTAITLAALLILTIPTGELR